MKTVVVETSVIEDGNIVEVHNIEIPLFESAFNKEIPWELVIAKVQQGIDALRGVGYSVAYDLLVAWMRARAGEGPNSQNVDVVDIP